MEAACSQVMDRPDVVIGTASPTGIYYPLGGSICRLFNLNTPPPADTISSGRCAGEPPMTAARSTMIARSATTIAVGGTTRVPT